MEWKKFKTPVLLSIAVSGFLLVLNSITAILPEWMTTFYQLLLGLFLIFGAMYLLGKKKIIWR